MATTGTPQKSEAAQQQPQRTPEELKLLATLERALGRKMTPQEAFLSLEQAHYLGEL